MMKLDMVVVIIVIIFPHMKYLHVTATCVQYSGSVCNKEKAPGVPHTYFIPDGKTQQQIELEITEALQQHTFNYIACKSYVKYLMCATKFRTCEDHRMPLCNDTCQVARDSVCFSNLKKNSKMYQWYSKEFVSKKSPGDCQIIHDRTDKSIIELSCTMDAKLKLKDAQSIKVSMITPNTPTPRLNRKYLLKHLPQYLKNDVICCYIKRPLHRFIKGNIKMMKNVIIDNVTERTTNGYCYSASTKTRVIPLALMKSYKPEINASFKNVQVVVIQKQRQRPFIVLIGQNKVCLQHGNFQYTLQEDSQNGFHYRGRSKASLSWKWIELAEGNPQFNTESVNTLIYSLGITQSLTFSNPTQTIMWNKGLTYKLFEDHNSSLSVKYYEKGDYYPRHYEIPNIQSRILIAGKQDSIVVHLVMKSGVSLVKTLKIILGDSLLQLIGDMIPSFNSYLKYLTIDHVEHFLQEKKHSLKIPRSRYFQPMKRLMDIYSKYPVVVDMYGQIGNLTELKMPWLEEADFVLKYQVTKDERKSFHFEMKTNYSTEDCKRKLVQDWSSFERLLKTIDIKYQHNYEENMTITSRNISCSVCCTHDVFTLKSTIIDEIDMQVFTASLSFVVLHKNKEITYKVRHYGIQLLQFDLKSYAKIKTNRRYLLHRRKFNTNQDE